MRGDRLGRWGRAAAALGLVTGGMIVSWPAGAASPPPLGTGRTATPLLSIRRLPGWVAQTVAAQRLDANLASILGQAFLKGTVRTSCVVVGQGGETLYAFHPTTLLIPASNMKLLTATAAIERLGASTRIVTKVEAPKPGKGGVIRGNLYLIGAGDPLLYTSGYAAAVGQKEYTSLDNLAEAVQKAGVTAITGSVVGDESRYDQKRTVPTWSPAYAAEGDVGPLSALEVNDGASPGPLSPVPSSASSEAALQSAAATNPAQLAAQTFTKVLRSDGISVPGVPTAGVPPARTPVLTSVTSAPLGQEVDAMLTSSDDTAAELFTKELGHVASGKGTTTAGLAAIRSALAADGLPVSEMVAYDGSGLDRLDKVTCNLLAADLEHVGAGGVVAQGLPIAGQTGTLMGRMVGTPAAGRVRAKTGTLDDVSSLSGFVLPAKGAFTTPGSVLGQPIVFASILDGAPSTDLGRAIGDEIGIALATYPQLPSLAAIEPVGPVLARPGGPG